MRKGSGTGGYAGRNSDAHDALMTHDQGMVAALNGNKNTRVEDYAHLLFSGSRG